MAKLGLVFSMIQKLCPYWSAPSSRLGFPAPIPTGFTQSIFPGGFILMPLALLSLLIVIGISAYHART